MAMRATPRPSIVSGAIVRDLQEQMGKAQLDTYGTRMPVHGTREKGYAGRDEAWVVKFCARSDGKGGYYESGGIVISVYIQRPETGAFKDARFERRLPEGYSQKRFYNAVTRLWHDVQQAQCLNAAREGLYRHLEGDSRKVTLSEDDMKAAEATGREMAYQSMNADDIGFWWAWVRERYPEKAG